MAKTTNGSVQWRWLGPVVLMASCAMGAYIVKGVDDKVEDHTAKIQTMDKALAVQQEILVRIETKIDSLIEAKEK